MPSDRSAETFASTRNRNTGNESKEIIMITDALSDVRVKYHIVAKEVGHGHYGVVRKCQNRETKEWFAIKSIRKSKVNKIEVLLREIKILEEVDHPNIINLFEVHEDVKYLHLITELCTGGELFDRIIAKTNSEEGHFSEKDAASLVRSILNAIKYCHDEKQIVHRDLKPENFLFETQDENARIKIIDFGLSRHDDQAYGVMSTRVGTPYYVAPEVLKREYTKSCDIWSIGVITYILLCGYPPFYGDSDTQIFDSVRSGSFDFPESDWDGISNSAKDFIREMLKMDSSKRFTANQALEHQWLLDLDSNLDGDLSHKSKKTADFQKYMGMKKLRKAALAHIASSLTKAEVGSLGQLFGEIDQNKDGMICLEELEKAVEGGSFSGTFLEGLRSLRDDLKTTNSKDASPSIYWKEFLAATMESSVMIQDDKIQLAFDYFKKSDSNHVSVDDLISVFGSKAQAQEILGDVDLDGDGLISFEEFKKAMEKVTH
uniref:Calmodulin n=1 Tax=Proboscia inermis TaxID=420281 RepID=A0A7S0GFI7_9STRA|mmetsp:Transcript_29048/g.29428  ORF Transcript_29048/g.29428 Transcript_29048/m.29428 type:complete len:488 (+) Transcript_29048:32-1495(+)